MIQVNVAFVAGRFKAWRISEVPGESWCNGRSH